MMDTQQEGKEKHASWRIAQRPTTLSHSGVSTPAELGIGRGGRKITSYSGNTYYPGAHSTSRLQRSSFSNTYSRHDQISNAPTLHTSLHITSSNQYKQHPTRRRISNERLSPAQYNTQWPIRPHRSSVTSNDSHTQDEQMIERRPSSYHVMQQYTGLLQHPVNGIPTQERIVNGETLRVFTGADGLEWFNDNMIGVGSMEQAKRVGTQLLKAGVIINVSGQGNEEFYGSPNGLYQFQDIHDKLEHGTTGSEHEPSRQEIQQNSQQSRRKKTCTIQ